MASVDITVWRIAHKKYADSLFTGEGAEIYGGRFNSPGSRVVYASGSLSLALLEQLVQRNKRDRLRELVYRSATITSGCVEVADQSDLPSNWNARPPEHPSQAFGDAWLDECRSLVLRVPSVIVPTEYNYLINLHHSAFSSIRFGPVKLLDFDSRLV